MKLGLVVFVFMQFLDVAETYYAIEIDGRYVEESLLVCGVVSNLSNFVGIKVLGIFVVILFIWGTIHYKNDVLGLITVWMFVGFSLVAVARNILLLVHFVNY
jgi:hypothetical protein